MKTIKKYLLFAFILENVAAQTRLFGRMSDTFFYAFLALGVFFLFDKELWSRRMWRACWWAYVMAAVYLVYEFLVGAETITTRSLLYVTAKIVTFVIALVGIRNNFYFYKQKMLYPLAIITTFFLLYGLLTGQGMDEERMMLGYTNSNTTSWMGAVAVGCILFSGKPWSWKTALVLIVGIYGLLAGGSRAGFLFMGLIVFFRYGLRPKTIFALTLGYFIATFLLPAIGLKTVGMQRMQETLSGTEGTNRELERQAAWMMIDEKPLTGWGFEAHNTGAAATLTDLGSHSGYLEILKFMGYPMGVLWIVIIVSAVLTALWKMYHRRLQFDFHLAYSITLIVIANFEAYFVGVHEFATTLFFVALAIASYAGTYMQPMRHRHVIK